MPIIKCETKQWGNSLGIIIPQRTVKELHIKPQEEIFVEINTQKKNVLAELFGAVKFSKPAAALVKEARKEIESKYMR